MRSNDVALFRPGAERERPHAGTRLSQLRRIKASCPSPQENTNSPAKTPRKATDGRRCCCGPLGRRPFNELSWPSRAHGFWDCGFWGSVRLERLGCLESIAMIYFMDDSALPHFATTEFEEKSKKHRTLSLEGIFSFRDLENFSEGWRLPTG